MINAIKRPMAWCRVLISLFATFGGVRCNVLSSESTVEKIASGKSLIRFGDGEFGIYAEKDIHYQPYTKKLGDEFVKIRETFNEMGEKCPYLLAVPKKYMQCSGAELCKKRVLVSSWAESRRRFKKNFDLKQTYGDAFLFQKGNSTVYSQLWNDIPEDKQIVFIHNKAEYAKMFEERYTHAVHFVQCNDYDAFSQIDELEQIIIDQIESMNVCKSKIQLVISAGPAGKVLAYRFSKVGYQCIDAGHCWDDPLVG